MNELLKYFTTILSQKTLSLKKKGILINKPWALIDDDGAIQKLIFKTDNGLILSKNGKVSEGSWEYFPQAKALLIDRCVDKVLLKEQYIDENVLILKKDGIENDFFAFANENTVPDYDVTKYLDELKRREFKIVETTLLNGKILQIHNGKNVRVLSEYVGLKTEQVNEKNKEVESVDGSFLTADKKISFHVKNGIVQEVNPILLKGLVDGNSFEIEGGSALYNESNKSKRVSINESSVPDSRLICVDNYIYEIRESKIAQILVINEYFLKDGSRIKIEQQNFDSLSPGDKIIESGIFPLPNGSYRIRGKLFKIHVKNNKLE